MTSYAVLFKTHFWDDFVARQVNRVRQAATGGELIMLIDETIEPVPPTGQGMEVRIQKPDFARLGLAEVTTHGSIIWYNTDYPHYVVFERLKKYDYYVCIEYDAMTTVDLDALVAALARGGLDYLGFPIRKACQDWPWYDMHRPIYGDDFFVYLSCLSIFSRRAMAHLLERRQVMTQAFQRGELNFWPNNEAFIPNELANAGMRLAQLGQYGDTAFYDWWPPCEEGELGHLPKNAFVHPVLAGARYARSVIHHEPSILSFINPSSMLYRRLNNVPDLPRARFVRQEVGRRLREFVKRRMADAGFGQRWYENALSGAPPVAQQASAHNRAK